MALFVCCLGIELSEIDIIARQAFMRKFYRSLLCMQRGSYHPLWLRIPAFDAAHVFASCLFMMQVEE